MSARLTALLWLIAVPLAGVALAASPESPGEETSPQPWREPHTGLEFVALPEGCFEMGTAPELIDELVGEFGEMAPTLVADEMPRHEVCLDPFWIGRTEVRAHDWLKVMGEAPPSGSGEEPAGGIRFELAQRFADRLTRLSGGESRFRLPTEAEWEYACRAGQGREQLPGYKGRIDVAWYSVKGHRVARPSPVAQLGANGWGLHDMLGNVWEWVADGYRGDGYRRHSLYNPRIGGVPDNERVIRGASFRSEPIQVRCANRSAYPAAMAMDQIGLRLVRLP